jgi:hypothetical protein
MSTVPSAINEALERLIDPPTNQSALLTLLAKIEQEAKSLPTLAEHNEYTEYRTAITVFNINVHLKSRRHILFFVTSNLIRISTADKTIGAGGSCCSLPPYSSAKVCNSHASLTQVYK